MVSYSSFVLLVVASKIPISNNKPGTPHQLHGTIGANGTPGYWSLYAATVMAVNPAVNPVAMQMQHQPKVLFLNQCIYYFAVQHIP